MQNFNVDINVHIEPQRTNKQLVNAIKQLGIFNFRALLNIGMLLTESEKAKVLRSKILDIVIDNLNQIQGKDR